MMISFHFPPIAASAAVKGQSLTGFARRRGRELPAGSFWRGIVMSTRVASMIVEVRKYPIKPGLARSIRQHPSIADHERSCAEFERALRMHAVGSGTST